MALEFADQVHTNGVALHLLKGESRASKSLLNSALAVDCLLDTKAMSDLTENDIPEESVLGEMGFRGLVQENLSGGIDHVIELLADDVLQKDRTGAKSLLNISVVREVQGDNLDSGVSLTGIIDGVAGEYVRTGPGLECLVHILNRKHALEFLETGDIFHKLLGPGLILKKHESLIRALDTQQLVVSGLIRADHEIHLAVLHLKPSLSAVKIIVSLEGFRLTEKIFLDTGLDGDICRRLKIIGYLVDMILISVMIPDSLKGTVFATADHCVRA